jgi:hypothetical protein
MSEIETLNIHKLPHSDSPRVWTQKSKKSNKMLTLPQMLFSSVLLLSVFQVNYSAAIEISSYARVSRNGADSINIQSDRGNKSNDQTSARVSDIDSAIIDK